MCEVADHAIMFDNASGVQNAGLSNPGHRSHVAMMANESPRADRRADANRSGQRDDGGQRPSELMNMVYLDLPFAIVPSRSEALPTAGQAIIERLDDLKAEEILVVAGIDVRKNQLADSRRYRDVGDAAGMPAESVNSQTFGLVCHRRRSS
jgi:hypothetical protein